MPNSISGTRFVPPLSRVASSPRRSTSTPASSGGTVPTNPFIGLSLRPRIVDRLIAVPEPHALPIGEPGDWIFDNKKDGKDNSKDGKDKEGKEGKDGKEGDDTGKEASDPDDLGARVSNFSRLRFTAPMM